MKQLLNPKIQAKRALSVARRTRNKLKDRFSLARHYSFNIDSPKKKLQDNKTLLVEGWILAKKGNNFKLRAINNGNSYPLTVNKRRPDVAKSHPELDAGKTLYSGFSEEFIFEDGTIRIELDEGKGFKKLVEKDVVFGLERLPDAIYNKNLSNNYPEHVNLLENRRALFYEDALEGSYERVKEDPRLIAIYLPQFYPFPENDKAWGKGFTEWSNVTTAEPRFIGHQQPILPKDLGFYDLRLEEKIGEQIELAKKYGIYGFSFYYYWFSGKKVLDRPLDSFLRHKEWDFKFSICWANENWTKRWDGRDSEVIIAQEYRDDDPLHFIKDVEAILLDERYITEDGKPILTVYRAPELQDPKRYASVWREYFRKKHGKELWLVSCLSFDDQDPREYGFDAALDFAPLSAFFKNDAFEESRFPHIDVRQKLLDINFDGTVADYRTIALNQRLDAAYDFPVYPCVTPSWDNDARKKGKGFIYQNSSPDIYAAWLERIIAAETRHTKAPIIYINAWNEWAEGAIMEPSVHLGHAVLNRTIEVLAHTSKNKENAKLFPAYGLRRSPKAKLAVVVHLYYTDLWGEIEEHLQRISEPYDLFITINERDRNFTPTTNTKGKVTTLVVPNRGRDVLPFLWIMRRIQATGYEYVLKLHSKKSKHRADGSNWFSDVLANLLPDSRRIKETITLLSNEEVGMIGPAGHLVSLYRHMGSNRLILTDLLKRAYNQKVATKVITSPQKYPYFGGTMFWVRVDALTPILDLHLLPDDFQSEHGQVDGTTAHALERMFGVVIRLEGKRLYELSAKSIHEVTGQNFTNKYTHAP